MSIRLYDSAWVELEGFEQPLQVSKDRKNASMFHIGDHVYDIDGRAYGATENSSRIVAVLSLQAAKEAGLSTKYNLDSDRLN